MSGELGKSTIPPNLKRFPRLPMTPSPEPAQAKSAGRLIKKYPNRRLYDTHTSAYITLTDIKQLVLDNQDFEVVDAKSGQTLTRSILLQIILEEESGGVPLFSSLALRQIIRFYGHAMQGVMGSFLDRNIQAFMEIQERFVEQSRGLYEGAGTPPGSEAWAQLMAGQVPVVQDMMENYVDQSKHLFVQMQEQLQTQMQHQMRSLFSAFPFAAPAHNQSKD